MEIELPKQINNINERVVDDLKTRLSAGSRICIAAASFSIYAFEALKKELESVEELRFIFTSPTFVKDKGKKEKREFFIPKQNRERSLYGTDFEIRLRNQLSQKAIAKECAEWIKRKVRFKSNSTGDIMGGFLHVADSSQHVYLPFNEFTTTELGCERGNSVYQMVNVLPSPTAEAYLKIFNEQWDNDDKFADVTSKVLEYIETVYQENSPEYIYFIALYNIFHEFLDDISEDVLPNERTGFKTSVIWSKLYNFQKDAALAIINKLEKYNGCILADSVGLGKTFTALAVIKYYENRNKSVLVLCPKKLNDNWQTFRANYKNNPIAADRLRYDILFHSDLSRDRGKSNGLDLEHINWGNYDLIVIDESHNFRNGGNVDEEEIDDGDEPRKENRYERLMNRVIRSGVKTKVLMLSATPVNNRFNDQKNQLQLAYEGKADNINEALELDKSIDDVFRNAQTVYNRWAKLSPRRAHHGTFAERFELRLLPVARCSNHCTQPEPHHEMYAYTVSFDSEELIDKAVAAIDRELSVTQLSYVVTRGEQKDITSLDDMMHGDIMRQQQTATEELRTDIVSNVRYDLLGKISRTTRLTRKTVATILSMIHPSKFAMFKANPEEFIRKTTRLIMEQKATIIVEHISYNRIEGKFDSDIFTQEKHGTIDRAFEGKKSIVDYVFTDSDGEREFVGQIDTAKEVAVYAKLPKGFHIPTPVGNYSPDWAIAFQEGEVKHIYFVAETKESMSSMDLREIEKSKISCAEKLFKQISSSNVKYGKIDSFEKLMDIVK